MKDSYFIYDCRACGSRMQIHCPPQIIEQVKQYLTEMGCSFCLPTAFMTLMADSILRGFYKGN